MSHSLTELTDEQGERVRIGEGERGWKWEEGKVGRICSREKVEEFT